MIILPTIKRSSPHRCWLPILFALVTTHAFAVFPDRPTKDFKSVGMIGTAVAGVFKQSGSGVAIAPGWVIAVSHIGGNVFIEEGKQYPILQKITQKPTAGDPVDLALFKLGRPVPFYSLVLLAPFLGPAGLNGKTTYLVGCGRTAKLRADGLGWQPVMESEGVRRVATNTIDYTEMDRYNIGSDADPKWKNCAALVYDIDKPGSPKLSTLGSKITSQEGGVGTKDSGGGWFVKQNGKMMLVAISATVGRIQGSRMPSPYCYGGLGFGVHLQPYKAWIYSVTAVSSFK